MNCLLKEFAICVDVTEGVLLKYDFCLCDFFCWKDFLQFSIGCVCFFCDPSFHQDVTSIVQSYGVVCLM